MKKTLTLLHSNDLHGDFLAEKVDEKLTGGVSMLSGYISKTRKEEKNVLYAISGDMFKGSLIDQEYRGISTIEIMNLLAPDVVTLGNHEVDYGLAHLLFLEKCAKFPIINANMFLTNNNTRLFNSHKIIEIDGMKIMFIGILTESVLESTRSDKLISTLVGIKDAAEEVGRICRQAGRRERHPHRPGRRGHGPDRPLRPGHRHGHEFHRLLYLETHPHQQRQLPPGPRTGEGGE